MFEFACHEANYSILNTLRGARFSERHDPSKCINRANYFKGAVHRARFTARTLTSTEFRTIPTN